MTLLDEHKKIFKTDKPMIGCVHLMALPGTPYYDPSISFSQHVERAVKEAKALQEGGFDAIIFANEGDRPYEFEVGSEVVAAYTRIATEVLQHVTVPYGCGVLIDPYATLAVAKAIDAKFVRTYVSGTYADMFGFHDFSPADIFRYQKKIGAEDVHIYSYFDAHAGTSLDNRSQLDMIDCAFGSLPISGVLVPGQRAGLAPDLEEVAQIKSKYPDKPILIASGVKEENVKQALEISDGFVIGTALKRDGVLWNEVLPERVKRFVEKAKG